MSILYLEETITTGFISDHSKEPKHYPSYSQSPNGNVPLFHVLEGGETLTTASSDIISNSVLAEPFKTL